MDNKTIIELFNDHKTSKINELAYGIDLNKNGNICKNRDNLTIIKYIAANDDNMKNDIVRAIIVFDGFAPDVIRYIKAKYPEHVKILTGDIMDCMVFGAYIIRKNVAKSDAVSRYLKEQPIWGLDFNLNS